MLLNKIVSNARYLNKCRFLLASPCHRTVLNNRDKCFKCNVIEGTNSSSPVRFFNSTFVANKYNKKSSQDEESDSEDDENDPSLKDDRDSKVIKVKVNSLRADLLLRAALSIARNKIEVIFYESKIRVNGNKIGKKSVNLNIGDEVDVIKGFSNVNPSHLIVSRVNIISAKEKDESILVYMRRYKSMLIENYPGINAYKSSESAST